MKLVRSPTGGESAGIAVGPLPLLDMTRLRRVLSEDCLGCASERQSIKVESTTWNKDKQDPKLPKLISVRRSAYRSLSNTTTLRSTCAIVPWLLSLCMPSPKGLLWGFAKKARRLLIFDGLICPLLVNDGSN